MKRKKLLIIVALATAVIVLTAGIVSGILLKNKRKPQNQENKATYLVTFYSDDGTVLKIDTVQENAAANPPHDPQLKYGNIFQSWDKELNNITQNMDVYPVYHTIHDVTNAFAVESVYTQVGKNAEVSLVLGGNVCVSGFDIIIRYDAEALRLESVLTDGAIVYNADTPGQIRMNYVSLENTLADVDVCMLTFQALEETGDYPVAVEVMSIYACNDTLESMDDTLYKPAYQVYHGMIYVLS